MSKEPQDWQEAREPTVQTYRLISKGPPPRYETGPRRRKPDHKLWESFSQDEQNAFEEIDTIREWVMRRMHCTTAKAQRFWRVDNGAPVAGFAPPLLHEHHLAKTFMDWSRLIVQDPGKGMDYSAIIAIISEGCSARQVDRDRRQPRGWARRNLGLGLELWCSLRGWT